MSNLFGEPLFGEDLFGPESGISFTLPALVPPTLIIDGFERPFLRVFPGSSVTRPLRGRQSARFVLYDASQSYRPVIGASVVLADASTTFTGAIDKITERRLDNTDYVEFALECSDYAAIFDHRFVFRRYPAGSIFKNIIQDIVANFCDGEGIDATHVDGFGSIADSLNFDGRSVAECLNQISDLSGEQWWMVDHSLYFHSLLNAPLAPFQITDTSQNWRNLEIEYSLVNYRNIQDLQTSINLASGSITDTHEGNGIEFFFATQFNLTSAPTVTVNGVAQTVLEFGVDAYPANAWFWTNGGGGVQQGEQVPPAPGAAIVISYGSFTTNIVSTQDDSAIAQRRAVEGGSGKWEALAQGSGIDNLAVAQALAAGLLRKGKEIPSLISYETDSPGLTPGMKQTVVLTANHINTTLGVAGLYGQSGWGESGWGSEPSTTPAYYYVTQIVSTIVESSFPGTHNYFRHRVSISSVLDQGDWQQWWMNMFSKTGAQQVAAFTGGGPVTIGGDTVSF